MQCVNVTSHTSVQRFFPSRLLEPDIGLETVIKVLHVCKQFGTGRRHSHSHRYLLTKPISIATRSQLSPCRITKALTILSVSGYIQM